MSRFLISAGVAALLAASAYAGPAAAFEQTAVSHAANGAAVSVDISARRHWRRYGYRHYPRYYGYRYSPYYAYAPGPYYYGPRYYYRRPVFPFWPFF